MIENPMTTLVTYFVDLQEKYGWDHLEVKELMCNLEKIFVTAEDLENFGRMCGSLLAGRNFYKSFNVFAGPNTKHKKYITDLLRDVFIEAACRFPAESFENGFGTAFAYCICQRRY